MTSWMLLSLAAAGELTEAVVLEEEVASGGRTFTSPEPMYLLPTDVFDRLLADAKRLSVCESGLAELEGEAEVREDRVDAALLQARGALTTCTAQILTLDREVQRARRQRNVAYGVAAALLIGGVAGAVAL